MKITADWFSNKENIKWLLVVVLSIVLVFVLKHRMSGGKDAEQSAASPHTYNSAAETPVTVKKKSMKAEAGNSKPLKNSALKAPHSLKRDIFAFRMSKNSSIREEDRKDPGLKLNATITDGREPLAIIGSEVLGIGDEVKGFTVTAIKNHEAVIFE